MFFTVLFSVSRSRHYTNQTQHTEPGSELAWNWAAYGSNSDYSNFDVKYKGTKTTYSNGGWCTEFQVDGKPQQWQRIHGYDQGRATYRDEKGIVEWNTFIERPLGPNYLLIKLQCKVNGTEPRRISLTCFADVMIANNDRATVKWYGEGDRRGLTMYDPSTKYTLTLLTKNGYEVTNYDYFWYGSWSGNTARHKLENRDSNSSLVNRDSAFSVGWENRVIYGNQEFNFTVLMGVGDKLQNPPVITIDENFDVNYKGGNHIVVTGQVKDYDDNEQVWVNWSIDTSPVQSGNISYNTSGLKNGMPIRFEFDLPQDVGMYNLTVQAIDSVFLHSNVYRRAMLVNEAPRLTVNRESLRPKYYTGGTVEVTGTFWDDRFARLGYKFKGDYGFTVGEYENCSRSTKPFRRQFALREIALSYGPQYLLVWAEDDFGVKTPEQKFEFEYIELHAPKITIDGQETVHEHEINEYIMITGKVYDEDIGEKLTVWYKDPLSDPTEPFQQASIMEGDFLEASREGKNFSVIFQIPRNYPTDGTKLTYIFQAQDDKDGFSSDATYSFTAKKVKAPSFPSPSPYPFPDNYLPPGSEPPEGNDPYNSSYTSYTQINATISEWEEEYSTWTLTYSSIQIYAPEPPATPAPTETPDATPEPFVPPGDVAAVKGEVTKKDPKKKNLIPIIAGAAAAVAVAAVVAGAIIWHEAAKKAKEFEFNEEDMEAYQDEMNDVEMTKENGMYNEDGNDDPFANEFDEEAPAEGVFPQN